MNDLRDAVLLLSRAVNCLTAALDAGHGSRQQELTREAEVCAKDARAIAQIVEER